MIAEQDRGPGVLSGIDGSYRVDGNGCWIWQLFIDQNGYGTVRREGRKWRAHRYSYAFHVGPIPDEMTVDHLCFVTACVNPRHLRLLSRSENSSNQRSAYSATCKRGHTYANGNLQMSRGGDGRLRRRCRTCVRMKANARNQRRRDGRQPIPTNPT